MFISNMCIATKKVDKNNLFWYNLVRNTSSKTMFIF